MRWQRWLAGFAIAVVIGHHVGTLFAPLGETGWQTEWPDWIDLLVPYAVVGSALGCLLAAAAERRAWLVAGVGAVLYVQGHGIHLAANSVGNARGSDQPVHLWDEVIGHYIWYAGTYLLIAALALALVGKPLTSLWRWPAAVLVGLTVTTNAIEGGTAVFTLLVALGFCLWAAQRSKELLLTFAVPVIALVGWAIAWQGFPQFSELGWI